LWGSSLASSSVSLQGQFLICCFENLCFITSAPQPTKAAGFVFLAPTEFGRSERPLYFL
jgi:hypothetical protein